jgi:signal transduction histidine kinase
LQLDENKIRQVIMNFIDNAIYYSRSGSVVKVSLMNFGNVIRFEVIDTGIGVPDKERHKLFTKFFRAENARRVRPDGTGIGLFMAKKVITAHGGTIIFESKENKGSTFGFSLHLPLKEHPEKLEE